MFSFATGEVSDTRHQDTVFVSGSTDGKTRQVVVIVMDVVISRLIAITRSICVDRLTDFTWFYIKTVKNIYTQWQPVNNISEKHIHTS